MYIVIFVTPTKHFTSNQSGSKYAKVKNMRYAFVFISIAAIWAAVIIMVISVPGFSSDLAQACALLMSVILFVIGFRRK
jgi:hypothetical protein